MLHAATSAASPAVTTVVPFALAVAIRRAVVSHCGDWRLRGKCLLAERKSIRKVEATAAVTCGEAPGNFSKSSTSAAGTRLTARTTAQGFIIAASSGSDPVLITTTRCHVNLLADSHIAVNHELIELWDSINGSLTPSKAVIEPGAYRQRLS